MRANCLSLAMTMAVSILAAAGFSTTGLAQDAASFPSKQVSIVVPSSPGGSVATQTRILAAAFKEVTGQPMVVLNKPGAMGTIGATFVYRAKPDGYTLLSSPNSPMIYTPLTHKSLSYDPERLTPITLMGVQPLVMAARGNFPGANLKDLIAYAKSKPDKTYYGSPGIGGGNHFASMLFAKHTGTSLKHIPHRGARGAAQALLKGEVDFFMAPWAVVRPWYREGKLKVFAVGTKSRAADAPKIPTFSELGYPDDFILTVWSVIVAPPGVPKPIAEKLSAIFDKLSKRDDVKERFKRLGVSPGGGTGTALSAMLARERKTWTRVARENNIQKK